MAEMPNFDESTLAKLAREMAMNVKNVHALFAEYGIDEEKYYELMAHNEYFKRLREQYAMDWNATTSTAERVKIGSLASLEQLLPILTKRALDEDKPEPLASMTGVGTLLAKTAGIGDGKTTPNASERFIITINLGADVEHYDKSVEINPNDVSPKEIEHGKTVDEGPEIPSLQQLRTAGEGDGAKRER
jgi:hypothetical protein